MSENTMVYLDALIRYKKAYLSLKEDLTQQKKEVYESGVRLKQQCHDDSVSEGFLAELGVIILDIEGYIKNIDKVLELMDRHIKKVQDILHI